jgi:hypothetical protein
MKVSQLLEGRPLLDFPKVVEMQVERRGQAFAWSELDAGVRGLTNGLEILVLNLSRREICWGLTRKS